MENHGMDKLSSLIPDPPDRLREPRNYHDWVLTYHVRRQGVRGIKANQFHRWLWPLSPTYSPELEQAIDRQDWAGGREIAIKLRDSYNTQEGIMESPVGKQSNHELVVRDIFLILGISFNYQVPITLSNGRNVVVDFELSGSGRYFEIYGVRRDHDYHLRALEEAKDMPRKLWWLDMINHWLPGEKASLLNYALLLDKQVCHQHNCSLSLFSQSIFQALCNKIVLLKGSNLSMCRNYLMQVGSMDASGREQVREELNQSGPTLQDKSPRYFTPKDAPRDEENKLVHPLTPKWMRQPMVTAQVAGGTPTLEQIVQELSSKYESASTWTDEEKVAVYFETPSRLMQAMKRMPQPMQRAAGNWYITVKQATKAGTTVKPNGKTVSFDFDRTLTRPHLDTRGEYMFYGVEPNLEMINKFKQYAAQGYKVGIVTSRNEGLEPPRGEMQNEYGQILLGVYDLIDEFQLPVSFVHFTNGMPKYPTLLEIGTSKHYDDDPGECENCKDRDIPHEHIKHPSDAEHMKRKWGHFSE